MSKYFYLIALFILSASSVFATDNTITCNQFGCSSLTNAPLFNNQNIYPGYQSTKTVLVKNDRPQSCTLQLKSLRTDTAQNNLPSQISFAVSGNGTDYVDTLDNFNTFSGLDLGELPAGSSVLYSFHSQFSPQAGNEFQNLTTTFDLNYNFKCDDESSPTRSPPTGNDPPVCNNPAPLAPAAFRLTPFSNGTITLHWIHPNTPYTHYLVAFGTQPGVYPYGDPNVGNEQHYTVRGLTSGAQYCFYVRTINGCMPGERTVEKCVNTGSTIPPVAPIPTNFQPGVLGAATEISPTTENVLGVEDSADKKFDWRWLLLLLLLPLLYGYFKKSKKNFLL